MSKDIEAQQAAFQRLGVLLFHLLGARGTRIVCTAACVGGETRASAEVVAADGGATAAPADETVVEAVTSLRRVCARAGQGAWFTLRAEITSAGAASVRYDWDNEPELSVADPASWLREWEMYPRDAEHTPGWLAAKVADAQQWQAGRAAEDSRNSMALTLDLSAAPPEQSARADAAVANAGSREAGESDFVGVIRSAVDADPTNLGLRVDLVELLLEHQPEAAAVEIEALTRYGANPQTVQVLRARAAAALNRKRDAGAASARQDQSPAGQSSAGRPSADQEPTSRPAQPSRIASGRDQRDANEPVWDVERPTVTLADVAGLSEVKKHLTASFLAPMRNPDLARMFGKSPRGSLLMYGPPGCGKTYIARAVAGELGASFVHATLADIMGQWFGETERAIHSLFEAARSARPCVIFFDEFDAIGGRRTSGSSGSAQALRMVASQLLEELDGVAASNDGIYVLAATNRPWDIDPALRRPGRLDRTVLILPPDEPAREAIVRTALRDKPAAAIDVGGVAKRTSEFSGADIAHLVATAVEAAFMDSLSTGVPRMITTLDLEQAAAGVTPSTRSWFEQIKPVLEYGVDDGTFGQLRRYLKKNRI